MVVKLLIPIKRNQTMRIVIFVILLLLIPACSSGPIISPVKGKISYKGKTIETGIIMFHSDTGPAGVGNIQKDGSYVLTTTLKNDGAVVGNHTVTIQATSVGAGTMEEPKSLEEEIKQSRATKILVPGKVTSLVPEKYSTTVTSTLKVEVKNQENIIDFDLKD